jgi:hypothetical protein
MNADSTSFYGPHESATLKKFTAVVVTLRGIVTPR